MWALAGGVAKAQRRIKIKEHDLGFQACRIDPHHVWVNCAGTCGVASVAYSWSRAAAAIVVRLAHYLFSDSGLEILLYVDDVLYVADSKRGVADIGFWIFVLTALGVPFKSNKFWGWTDVSCIGSAIDLRRYRLGVSAKRAAWMRAWLLARLEQGRVDKADFTAVLGRLSIALGPLEESRPFIAPLYA